MHDAIKGAFLTILLLALAANLITAPYAAAPRLTIFGSFGLGVGVNYLVLSLLGQLKDDKTP